MQKNFDEVFPKPLFSLCVPPLALAKIGPAISSHAEVLSYVQLGLYGVRRTSTLCSTRPHATSIQPKTPSNKKLGRNKNSRLRYIYKYKIRSFQVRCAEVSVELRSPIFK